MKFVSGGDQGILVNNYFILGKMLMLKIAIIFILNTIPNKPSPIPKILSSIV